MTSPPPYRTVERAASLGLATLADKGYTGSGISINALDRNPAPVPDARWCNELITSMRAPAERGNALIKHFKALRHVTFSPIAITTAALVTFTSDKGFWQENRSNGLEILS